MPQSVRLRVDHLINKCEGEVGDVGLMYVNYLDVYEVCEENVRRENVGRVCVEKGVVIECSKRV